MPGSTRSYEMARRLVKSGHEVHMITSRRENLDNMKGWDEEIIEGINVHWYPIAYSNNMGFSQRIKAFMKFVWTAAIKTANLQTDVIFATSTPLTIALPAVYAAKRLNVPMVFEVRDLWPTGPIAVGSLKNPILIWLAKCLEKWAYANSSRIIALSSGMYDGVVRTGFPAEKISVIPNGSDIGLFRGPVVNGADFLARNPFLQGGPLVVYTGAFGTINGVGYLVEIASKMYGIDKEVKFLLVGDGKEKELILKQAMRLGVLEKNLWVFKPLVKREIPSVLSAATVATSICIDLPENRINSANKLFDALAAGKPFMINYRGWQAELLEKEQAGIVVPADDPKIAARILYDFLQDKERLAKAGIAAAKLADEVFDRDKLANQFRMVIEDTVEEWVR